MSNHPDHKVHELGDARLQLRGDLVFAPSTSGGEQYCVVEDPASSRFFRLGFEEYTFVSLLDGCRSVSEAYSHLSTVIANHHLSQQDAIGVCRWLVEMGLAHTPQSSGAERLAKSARRAALKKMQSQFNPLVFRLPVGRPDRVVGALASWCGWVFSPVAHLVWLALLAVGLYELASAWDRFSASSEGIFAPSNWLWLGACWLVLKLVHELGHAVACRRYGGCVREMGALFILCAPLAYVDVTSSWRFRSRWQRIHVATAGMYIELLIASAAAILWSRTGEGWLNHMCYNVILMAGVATLLFNANPLMRFDGYFILSDALGIPNLYSNGQQYVRYLGRKCVLGVGTALPVWPRPIVVRVYGVAAFAWRWLICLSMTLAATVLFHGAGILLALAAAAAWFGLPAANFGKYFVCGRPGERPRRWRIVAAASTMTAVIAALLLLVPWPGSRDAPAVVEYSPHVVVRSDGPGFVRSIHVRAGQQVRGGQLLLVLENRELASEVAELKLQIKQAQIHQRRLQQRGELAASQAEQKKRESLQTKLAEKRGQLEKLSVRAPRDGSVVRRNLAALQGTYLKTGDEIVVIGSEDRKELRASISQDDLNAFSEHQGNAMRVRLPGRDSFMAKLVKVVPRGDDQPLHPALMAINGGTLPVAADDSGEHRLLAPRFTAIVDLPSGQSGRLAAGQTGTISHRALNESIGEHLYQVVSRWIERRLRQPDA